MDPVAFLKDKQPKLVEKWIAAIISAYPAESARFFIDTKDPFANPVGTTIKRCVPLLFDEVIKEKMDPVKVTEALEPIIRLRAVQEMPPSKAVSFIPAVKHLIKTELKRQAGDPATEALFSVVESNVDSMVLAALDMYVGCRDKVYSLRINQAKESVRKLLIKKDLMCDIPDINTELQSVINTRCTGVP